jgi:hypothetical protein
MLVAVLGASSARAYEAATDPDEKILEEAKVETDNASLLAYLRKKCGDEAALLRMSGLVRQLGSETFDERKSANRKLVALGYVAVPYLQHAAREGDPETSRQAKSCLTEIAKETNWWVTPAVIRLLVRRNPDGTTDALVRYLPFAPEGDTEEEIWFGLSAMASSRKVSQSVLRKALDDPLVARRSLAACILGRMGSERDRQAVRNLLADSDPTVRLRAAQGLLAARDKTSIPTLISLLDEISTGIAWQAEELLRWIAGENSPKELLGSSKRGDGIKCRKAWENLWKSGLQHVDLWRGAAKSTRPGLILVSGWDSEHPGSNLKSVWLCGSDGTVRWQKRKLTDVSCARMINGGKVLTAEAPEAPDRLRVVEQTLNGIVEWKAEFDRNWSPCFCSRLPSGETIIGCFRISAVGKPVLDSELADFSGTPQCLAPNGNIICIETNGDSLIILDALAKRVLNTVTIQVKKNTNWYHNHLQALCNGNYLLAIPSESRVMELTAEGKPIWEYNKAISTHAVPIRDGSILVAAREGTRGRLILLNAKGKAYSEIIPHDVTGDDLNPCFNLLRIGFDDSGAVASP